MASDDLYVISGIRAKSVSHDQLLTLPDADTQGRVLFRSPVSSDKFEGSLANCISATIAALKKAASVTNEYSVDEVKLCLGLDASVGCTFLGEGKLEASIEVTIRKSTGSSVPPTPS